MKYARLDEANDLINALRNNPTQEAVLAAANRIEALEATLRNQTIEAQEVCAEAYQVVGSLLSDVGLFDTDRGDKILDNLNAAKMIHSDVLPWASTKSQIDATQPAELSHCPSDVCQASQSDGILCANDECDRANGVRPKRPSSILDTLKTSPETVRLLQDARHRIANLSQAKVPFDDPLDGPVLRRLDAAIAGQQIPGADPTDDDQLRSMWRNAGGDFHGPVVETGTMPEQKLLPFLRTLLVKPIWSGHRDSRVKPDTLVNAGALTLALNVLRRAGKNEVADELEMTALSLNPPSDNELTELWTEVMSTHFSLAKQLPAFSSALIERLGKTPQQPQANIAN